MSSAELNDEGTDDLVEIGDWGEVRHAIRTNGVMEAKEWLEAPTNRDAHRFDHVFIKICAEGRIVNQEQFRHLSDEIWEFKRAGHRILCFQEGRCWRLTHHYAKKTQKCPRSEIDRAKQIQTEHRARRARRRER